ncbi:MAG: hypothetical protein JSV85_02320 [Candidatus Bathyarchaeota archaeon]|nr:MAG: hypothetical protein JSV85_02320 [Candidatus Bathyarchaeota archaeon]
MKDWNSIIEKSDAILSPIFKGDSVFLLFHDDADGCTAAAIILDLIARKTSKEIEDFTSPEKHSIELTPRTIAAIAETGPKYIVSVDLALTRSVNKAKSLLDALNARMLVYDHHVQSRHQRWPETLIHLNPLNFNLGNKPASCYAYMLHRHYTGGDKACWTAATGVVADYRTAECKDLIEETKVKHPSLYPFETVDQETAINSPLMTMAYLVNAGYQHSDYSGARLAVETLVEAMRLDDPHTLLEGKTKNAKTLQKFKTEIDEEYKQCVKNFDFCAEFHLNSRLAFYSIDPKYNITSQLATELQHKNPSTIIAVISPETPTTIKISLRKGSKVRANLSDLAESTVRNLANASGGGHPDAAGCVLQKKDIDIWKKTIVKALDSTA